MFPDDHQSPHVTLPTSSVSLTSGFTVRPSSKQVWDRIKRRMQELHPELASTPPLTYSRDCRLRGSQKDLIHDLYPLSSRPLTKAVKGSNYGALHPTMENESAQEFIVLTHNPTSSMLSVRLPPIDDNSISPSGRKALQKLREEVHLNS